MPNTKVWIDPDTAFAEQVPDENPIGMYPLSPLTQKASLSGAEIEAFILAGQGFSLTTGILTSGATAGIYGVSLFNPTNSGKTLLVYSLKSFAAGGATQPQTTLTTTDPALGNTITPLNNNPGSGISSIASGSYSSGVVSVAGTVQDVGSIPANYLYEVFDENRILVLMPGNGLAHYLYATATSKYGATIYWCEN